MAAGSRWSLATNGPTPATASLSGMTLAASAADPPVHGRKGRAAGI
jgi:hypothetical protein